MNVTFLRNSINFRNKIISKPQANHNPLLKNKVCDDFASLNVLKNYNIAFLGNRAEEIKKEPIYIIDIFGNYMKFDTPEEAACLFNIPLDRIIQCANGEVDYVRDFVCAYAENIEDGSSEDSKPDEMMIGVCSELLKAINRPKVFLSIDKFLERQNEKIEKNKQRTRENYRNSSNKIAAEHFKNEETASLISHISLDSSDDEAQDDVQNSFDIDSIPEEDLTNTNPRFLKTPFYAMTKDEKYRKFYLQAHIAKSLNVTKQSVSKALRGERKLVNGVLALCWADEIEQIDENGKLQINLEPLKERFKKKNSSEGFYVVDKSGNYKKFYSPKVASKTLNVPYVSILRCLLNKQYCAGDYVCIKAKDIEIICKDGSVKLDIDVIKERKVQIFKGAVYLVGEDRMARRYDDATKAARAIGVSRASISACVLGRRKFVNGFAAFSAAEIETYDKNGRRRINKNKLEKLYNNLKEPEILDLKNGFYACNKSGWRKKYYKIADAERELKVLGSTISGCLKNRLNSGGGYIFILADEIEIKDENNEVIKDENNEAKIDEVKLQKRLEFFEDKALYVVYKNGKCTLYDCEKDASEDTKIPLKRISECITGRKKSVGDVAFVPAKKLQLKDDAGDVTLDENMLKEITDWLNRKDAKAFYAIDEEENYQRFSTRSEGIEALKVDKANLSACLLGKKKTTGGYAYINACEVETIDSAGNVVVDVEKIKERAKLFVKKPPEFKTF